MVGKNTKIHTKMRYLNPSRLLCLFSQADYASTHKKESVKGKEIMLPPHSMFDRRYFVKVSATEVIEVDPKVRASFRVYSSSVRVRVREGTGLRVMKASCVNCVADTLLRSPVSAASKRRFRCGRVPEGH